MCANFKAGTIDRLSSLSIVYGQKTIIEPPGTKINNVLKTYTQLQTFEFGEIPVRTATPALVKFPCLILVGWMHIIFEARQIDRSPDGLRQY